MPKENDAKAYQLIAEVDQRLAKLEVLMAISENIKAQIAQLLDECAVLQNSFDPKESLHESGSDQHRTN